MFLLLLFIFAIFIVYAFVQDKTTYKHFYWLILNTLLFQLDGEWLITL